jgi:hypothetical protein
MATCDHNLPAAAIERVVYFTLNEDKRLAKFLKRPIRVASKERESLLNTQNNSKLAELKIIKITFTQK